MKKILFSIILCCISCYLVTAQNDKNRTTATKIADLLAKSPAEDSVQFKSNAEAVADLGENGLAELVAQLNAGGDDTRLRYAISGFSFYATRPGFENWRSLATNAYGKTLATLTNPEARLFVISQLQQVGKDDAIASLVPFLKDARLADPAARALSTINTAASKEALLNALPEASGTAKLAIIEELGNTAYQPAAKAIAPSANSEDQPLKKVSLHALAQIADASSEGVLAEAAAKAGYQYDNTEATAAYLLYLKNQYKKGAGAAVNKKAADLMKKLKAPEQIHTRIALLKLQAYIAGSNSTGLLTAAMKDDQIAYRKAALQFAKPYLNETTAATWINTIKKSTPAAKSEIINMLASNGFTSAYAPAVQLLQSSDAATRMSVMNAAAISGKSAAIPALLGIMKKADAAEATSVKNALLLLDNKDVVPAISGAIAGASNPGKAALLDVLGEKAAGDQVSLAVPYLTNADPAIKSAAGKALEKMVSSKNLPEIFAMLSASSDPADQKNLQNILISGLNGINNADQRSAMLLQQYQATPAAQKAKLYPVFSGTGGPDALKTISNDYANTGDAEKSAIISALSGWKNGEATNTLFRLIGSNSNPSLGDALVKGFIQQIPAAKYTPEQKFLLTRGVMESTSGKSQLAGLLDVLPESPVYGALVYAGNFLQDPVLKVPAATAIKDIAMRNPALYGEDVQKILQEAMPVLNGPEADYQREALRKYIAGMPKTPGFRPIFNGKDLSGWKGLVADPIKRSKMDAATLAKEQVKADEVMRQGWSVVNGNLVFGGHGENLCTDKKYGDFELLVDWKIQKDGDAGIYLRGTPQVQIWDTTRRDVGAEVGSGGLYNNQQHQSKPLVLADNAIGEWNNFRIIMVGDQVTVYLNGQLVVDKIPLENYWDRALPLFTEEQIELQAHGSVVAYRDILIREIASPKPFVLSEQEKKENFKVLFDGSSLHEWVGNKSAYVIEDGTIAVYPKRGGHGNLFTKDEFSDFIFRFEFKLTPGANNGVGIRAPLEGDAAYEGMEIQVLDNDADIYKNLQVYQYHGSVYGVIPAKRGYLKPTGEWNQEEIAIKGNKITVTLNGTVITEGDIAEASKNGTLDHREHPGLARTKGHIGFLGHGDTLFFRNIRVKDLSVEPVSQPVKKSKKKK